jgi:MraZ protein
MKLILTGNYTYSIDNKGRVVLPIKFRELINENAVITNGYDGCIAIYPELEWERFSLQYTARGFEDQESRSLRRKFIGCAENIVLDSVNRIKIPHNLLLAKNITSEVVIIGLQDHIEIWDKEIFNKRDEDAEIFVNGSK